MAGYRQIHTKIWKDEWFIDLEPDEKLLFIYLFSNELGSIAGIYKIAKRVIMTETGLDMNFIKSALDKFQEAGKVYSDGNVIWIVNMSRYHANASETTKKRVMKDVEIIEDCPIKRKYLKVVWGIDTPSEVETGHTYPIVKDKYKDKLKKEIKSKDELETKAKDGASVSTMPEIGGDLFDELQHEIEQTTGYLSTAKDVPALREMVTIGATPDDIRAAVAWFSSQDKVARGAAALLNSVKYQVGKRKQAGVIAPANGNGKRKRTTREIAEEAMAEWEAEQKAKELAE